MQVYIAMPDDKASRVDEAKNITVASLALPNHIQYLPIKETQERAVDAAMTSDSSGGQLVREIESSGVGDSLLQNATQLTTAALKRSGDQAGNVMVFLPGWKEMCQVQQDLMEANPGLYVLMLHSDVVGDVNEDKVVVSQEVGQMVVLSSVIGARPVTLPE